MKITINSAKQQPQIPASSMVNKVGKYLYEHIDGAYKFKKDRNTYDLFIDMQYQKRPQYTESPPVEDMKINISITTYQNKVRVDTIEVTPMERTLGYDLFKPEELTDLADAQYKILRRVKARIQKAYPDCILSI